MLWVLYSKFHVILSFASHLVSFNKLHQRHFTEKMLSMLLTLATTAKLNFCQASINEPLEEKYLQRKRDFHNFS